MLDAGSLAPGFELSDHAGRTVKLSDFQGKKSPPLVLPQGRYPG